MIVNEIAKFGNPLQARVQLLLVAELGEALFVGVLLLGVRRAHRRLSSGKGLRPNVLSDCASLRGAGLEVNHDQARIATCSVPRRCSP